MKKTLASFLFLFAFFAIAGTVSAGPLFWSANGTTQGGAGTWDTTTANRWSTANTGPFDLTWNNANSDTAVFAGTAGAVTVGASISVTAGGMIFTNSSTAAFSIAPGTSLGILLTGNPTIFLDGNTIADSVGTNIVGFGGAKVTCAGTLTKTGGGRLTVNNVSSSIGKLVVNGGCVTTGNNTAASEIDAIMGAAPASLVADNITLNGGGIGCSAVANQTNPNKVQGVRGIVLGNNGGWFGSGQAIVMQIGGPISGTGDLIFPGKSEWPGQSLDNLGIFSLTNQANSYAGQTRVSAGELRLGTNNVLPTTTTINVTNSLGGLAGTGKFNLFGFTNRVTKLLLDSAGASVVMDSVGGGKLYADEVELRTSTTIVSVSNAVFAGTGMLRKTTAGTISINSTNIYTGDTRIEAGTLVLTNNGTVSGSFSNSANISVYAGATLKVTNRLDGKLTIGTVQNLNGGGTIHGPVVLKGNVAPGSNGTVGTLNVVGDQTWDAGSKYTWDINAASGTAGADPGWDQLNIAGGLIITASQANPMTIYVTSRTLANALGSVSDFNNTTEYSWSIAKTTTGITGFDTNAFVIDSSSFSNPLDPTGVFRITTNATDVLLVYALRTTQTITFNALANQIYGDTFDPGATASSGLPVTYSVVSGPATNSGSTITVTGLGSVTVRASQAGNSTFAPATSIDRTFTALAAPLTVSAAAVSRAYGSSNPSFSATYSGFKLGETLGTSDVGGVPTLTTAATASSVPGNYTINVSAGTLTSSHYSLSYSPGTLTVTQAVLTVTADDKTRPFNTANPTLTYTITGYVLGQNQSVVGGTAGISTTATLSSNPGQYPITVTQGSLSAANYSFAFVSGTLTVSGYPLTVTAVSTNRVYGDANPTFTVTYSGFVDGDNESVISGSPGFTTTATATSTVAGGPYTITPNVGTLTAARYSFTTFVDAQLTITKRPLTVTANNASRAYGAANPSFSASYSGFVNSDNSSVVSGSPQFSTTATVTSTVSGSPYTITPSIGTLDAANYSFGTFVDGQLTITPAALSVTADNKIRAVGAANPTFTGIISASQNGDSFSATYSTSADESSPIGTYSIVPTLVDPGSKAGNYNVTLNNGTLTVTNDPVITGQPLNRTNIAGETAIFTVTVSTATSVQYQWQKGGINIANATDSALNLLNVSQTDAGSYSVIVSNLSGSATSSTAKLTVIDPISIVSGPANATVPYGTLATFGVTVSGTSPKYQWRKDGVNLTNSTRILGATTATLSITNAIPDDFGSYSVVVTNTANAVTSGSATLSLIDPGIVTQPASRTNNVGDNAVFTVSAGGATTLTYQWKFNGGDITDATNGSLTVSVTDSNKAGTYSVVVGDGNGTITSSDAVLSVFFPTRTKITQWNFNSTTPDTNVTSGVTTPSIGVGTVSVSGAANNNWNTGSTSDPAPTADNSSRRWDSLAGTAVNKTAGAKYAVSTVGYKNIAVSGELWLASRSSAYWRGQYSTNSGTDWVDRDVISRRGANLAGFQYFADDLTGVPGVANNSNFMYRVVAEYESTATGSGSTAYISVDPTTTFNSSSSLFGWDMVTVLGTALAAPVVQSSPASLTQTAGDTAVFSASASGPGIAVVWTKDGNGVGTGDLATVGGVTTSTLTIQNVHMSDAATYRASFSNEDGSADSAAATLVVQPASLTITSDNVSREYGETNSVLTGGTTGLLPGDSITVSYSTVAEVFSGVGGYEIAQTIDDPTGVLANYTVTTNNGTLNVTAAPLSVTADNKSKLTGDPNPTLTGSVVGTKNGDNITGSFTTAATDASPAGSYTITAGINDPDGKAVNYNVAYHNGTLSVSDPATAPIISQQPVGSTTNAGATATFTVAVTGADPLTYSWLLNGAPIADGGSVSGASTASLAISDLRRINSGDYSVVISNAFGTATSAVATLFVNDPAILTGPVDAFVNAGQPASFSVTAAGTPTLKYQWYFSNSVTHVVTKLLGKTASSLPITSASDAVAGGYFCVVANVLPAPNTATSSVAMLIVSHGELIVNTDLGTGSGNVAHVGTTKYGTVGNHANLLIGHAYTARAIPASGCIFSNWTDGNGNVLGNGATLKNFVMVSNLVLNANFMTNPIIANNFEGKYNGLFYEVDGNQPNVKVQSAGLLSNLSIKSKAKNAAGAVTAGYGPVSGKITVDGGAGGFAGIFDLNGDLKKSPKLESVVISRSRKGKPDLLVNLHLDYSGQNRQVTGTISNMTEGGWVAEVSAALAVTTATEARSTMAISPGTNTTELPGGYGFGTILRKANGGLGLAGKVADGQPISQSINPDVNGKWPVYAKLYSGGGIVLGWLDISSGVPTGDVSWVKPAAWANPKNINYLNGFNAKFGVSGSAFTAPASGTRILTSDSNNYLVTATDIGAGTESTLSWYVNLTTANKFVVLPGSATNALKLTAKATGEIAMKFRPTHSTTGDKVVAGVVLQASTNMFGAFQNSGTIGGVTVEPAP